MTDTLDKNLHMSWEHDAIRNISQVRYFETGVELFYLRGASGVPRGRFGVFNPPPPKFRRFDKVEPDCKLSGKCLGFLFQHPN